MKKKNISDYVIALSVIFCSLVLLTALTIALTGYVFQTKGSTLAINFNSIAGIHCNSQIRYAGKKIGFVREIHFLTLEERRMQPENMVRVTAQLDTDAPPFYEGTSAMVTSDTILAEKFIDIVPSKWNPNARVLAQNAVIQGQPVISFDELTRVCYFMAQDLSNILSNLHAQEPNFHLRLGSLIHHADELMSRLDRVISQNDMNLTAAIRDLKVTSQNLKVTSTYTKTLASTIAEKPWRLVWGGNANTLPSEEEILKAEKPVPMVKADPKKTETKKTLTAKK